MLQAADIRKSYGDLQILKGVQLSVNQGEIVSIVGRSGAGKSTLLHILGLLDKADSGALRIGDTDVAALDKRRQSAFRNQRIGFIFQFHHLLPEFTALENAAMPALIAGESRREALRRASELLDYLGLGPRLDHKPGQLSGGEQQRAAVARALVNRPDLVLADEPTGNLDSAS
ncbi:MAG: ABC transporter ATP-binding protein, partial [Saprospiraceae bacterium]